MLQISYRRCRSLNLLARARASGQRSTAGSADSATSARLSFWVLPSLIPPNRAVTLTMRPSKISDRCRRNCRPASGAGFGDFRRQDQCAVLDAPRLKFREEIHAQDVGVPKPERDHDVELSRLNAANLKPVEA